MAIPKYDEIMIPAMKLLQSEGKTKLRDFVVPLSKEFNLTDEEINEVYPSGNGYIFYDRISWALSYLNMSKLIEKPARGIYCISEEGVKILKTPEKMRMYISEKLNQREPVKSTKKKEVNQLASLDNSDLTPKENLYLSFTNIRKSVYEDIINTILTKSPVAFEKLVVLLLQKMGYGGEVENSGLVTKVSNDGGIDGIIKEDILGLGRIHLQAKRYQRNITIGREDLQKFVGALAVAQSNKGVFITTSDYSKGVREYVESLNGATTVVLINGSQLAEYIYDYGLGMQVEQTIEIKKLDSDFWDGMNEA